MTEKRNLHCNSSFEKADEYKLIWKCIPHGGRHPIRGHFFLLCGGLFDGMGWVGFHRIMATGKKRNFFGEEFDWLAVDRDGHVGHFSTAGYGPAPVAFTEQGRNQRAAFEYIMALPKARLLVPLKIAGAGDLSDWQDMAKRGIFSFDHQDWNGPYQQVAQPLRQPLRIDELPEHVRAEIESVRLEGISFRWRMTVKATDCPAVFGPPRARA